MQYINNGEEYYCSDCGNTLGVDEKYCSNCGANIEEEIEQDSLAKSIAPKKELKGIGGWLLFLCISLIFFAPLVGLVQAYKLNRVLDIISIRYDALANMYRIVLLFSWGLMVFSIYAGISLWRIKPGAVQLTKRYLIVYPVIIISQYILLFGVSDVPARYSEILLKEGITSIIRAGIYVGVWYSYLTKSERVKNTFLQEKEINILQPNGS